MNLFRLVAIALLALSPIPVRSEEPAKARQYLYVVCPGIRNLTQYGGAGILVFVIAEAHTPLMLSGLDSTLAVVSIRLTNL